MYTAFIKNVLFSTKKYQTGSFILDIKDRYTSGITRVATNAPSISGPIKNSINIVGIANIDLTSSRV